MTNRGTVLSTVLVLSGSLWGSPVVAGPQPPCHPAAIGAGSDGIVAAMERCYYEGALDQALIAGDEAISLLESASPPDSRALARVLTEWGRISATRAFLLNTQTDSAEAALERALTLVHRDDPERVDVLVELGFAQYVSAYLGDGDYAGIRESLSEAWRIAERLDDAARMSRVAFHLGLIEERSGRADAALERYREALALSRQCACALEESYARRHIAFMYSAAGDHDSALDEFLTSLALRRQIGFRVYLPFSLTTVADELLALGRPMEAEPYASEARDLAEELGIKRVQVLALLTSAEVHLGQDAAAEAADEFQSALRIAEEIGYREGARAARDGLVRAGGAATPGAAAQQSAMFPTLPADAPVGDGATQPCLERLPGEVLCGRFRVWENRDARTGRTLDLAFVVLRALGDQGNRDAFIQFGGGPGAPATPNAPGMARYRADIRADRDLLLVDARGTGASAELACDNPFPGGIPSRFETVFPLDHIDACRDMLSRRADLSQYTTPNAMDDLADLASWLGYAQLDLHGGSYGTREAQIFTRRHPDMVRTVILNGVAPVDERVYLYHARYLQEALDRTLDECRDEPTCAAAYPQLDRVLADVLATATDDPPEVAEEGVRVPFGIGPLSYALRGLLYGLAGSVPARLYEAHAGNWQPLADYYLSRQSWVGEAGGVPLGYHLSVLCAEDVDPLSWDDIRHATAGTFMGDFLIAGYKRACDRWPSAELPPEYFRPVHSDKPVLILSGGRDPVTPVSGADHVAEGWPNHLHVVVPNGGHGQGGPCIGAMVVELVRTGSLAGIDTSCVEDAPPTRFDLPGG